MATLLQIPQDAQGQRLDRWLRQQLPNVPYVLLQKWLRTGQIRLDGKRVKPSEVLKAGQQLRLPPFAMQGDEASVVVPKQQTLNPKTLKLLQASIIFEDDDLIALNKPRNLAVQGGTETTDHVDLYLEALTATSVQNESSQEPAKLRLVHRLDKDTTGVLLIAKTYAVARELTGLFRDHAIEKTYLAWVVGKPTQRKGHLEATLGKRRGVAREKMSTRVEDGSHTATAYECLRTIQNHGHTLSLLELKPLTGKTHQLRVHCAQLLDCPILGDGKYGGKAAQPFLKRLPLHLHAAKIQFQMPSTGRTYEIKAPLPTHFDRI